MRRVDSLSIVNGMDNQDPTSPDAWRFFENQSEYENVRESVLPTDGNYSSDGEFTRIAAQEGAALEAQPLKVIKTESEDNADYSNMAQHSIVQVNCNLMKHGVFSFFQRIISTLADLSTSFRNRAPPHPH